MANLAHDFRAAARQTLRHPGPSAAVVLTLALGIGANSSMFSFVNAVLFTTPQVPAAEHLAWITKTSQQSGVSRDFTYGEYLGFKGGARDAGEVAAFGGERLSLGGEPFRSMSGRIVSLNYFDVLGVRAVAGRVFMAADSGRPVVVLGYGLWQNRFGGDPHITDSTISVNGHRFSVLGVAPQGFGGLLFGENAQLWIPLELLRDVMPEQRALVAERGTEWLQLVTRLADGGTVARAHVEAATLGERLRLPGPPADEPVQWAAAPVRGGLSPEERTRAVPLFLLMAAVPALVLLVACANAGNLRLARAAARAREFALRRALGATRALLIRQLAAEALLLAVAAGVCGVGLSVWLTSVIGHVGGVSELARMLRPDGRVLLASAALAMAATVLFGVLPAIAATRPSLLPAINDDATMIVIGRQRHRLRDTFVVAQVAISLVLLIVAGLFLRSTEHSLRTDPGFDARNGVAVILDLGSLGYDEGARIAFGRQLLAAGQTAPGVKRAALASFLPLLGGETRAGTWAESMSGDAPGIPASTAAVSAGYFATLGTVLVEGREFSDRDERGATPVVIVNQTLARRLWPSADPVGQRLRIGAPDGAIRQVVGVAREGKYGSPNEDAQPFAFIPIGQAPAPLTIMLLARTTREPYSVGESLRPVVSRLEPRIQVNTITLELAVRRASEKQHALSSMLGVFGGIALLVAALGMFAVTAYAVTMRSREIGICMALGARGDQLIRQFVGEGIELALVGTVIGLVASAAASRMLAHYLVGVGTLDPPAFAIATIITCAVAAAASYLPARRAALLDPMVTLRA